MSEKLKAMDVYSSVMDIPFEVAAYCRGHRFSVEAVNLAKAIRKRADALDRHLEAERAVDAACDEFKRCIKAVEANLTTKRA